MALQQTEAVELLPSMPAPHQSSPEHSHGNTSGSTISDPSDLLASDGTLPNNANNQKCAGELISKLARVALEDSTKTDIEDCPSWGLQGASLPKMTDTVNTSSADSPAGEQPPEPVPSLAVPAEPDMSGTDSNYGSTTTSNEICRENGNVDAPTQPSPIQRSNAAPPPTTSPGHSDDSSPGPASELEDGTPSEKLDLEAPATSTLSEGCGEHEKRTTDLIRKQISEIEREISRRIQNKNVKKIDETELAQLLSNHGFGNFVGATTAGDSMHETATAGGVAPIDPTKPSLNQLRSSFSPPGASTAAYNGAPGETAQQLAYSNVPSFAVSSLPFASATTYLQGSPAALVGVMPQAAGYAFTPQHQHPYGVSAGNPSSPYQPQAPPHHYQNHCYAPQVEQHQVATQLPYQNFHLQHYQQQFPPPLQAQFAPLSSTPSTFQLPQQQRHQPFGGDGPSSNSSNSSPPLVATALPPTLSSITPEMAAALLQQLQQQNPALLASFVAQQQHGQAQQGGSNQVETNRIPSPPKPQYNISRREPINLRKSSVGSIPGGGGSGGTKRTSLSKTTEDQNGWREAYQRHAEAPIMLNSSAQENVERPNSSSGGENKENGASEQDPVWVLRESYLKRLQRDEIVRGREEVGGDDGGGDARRDMEEEEQETDKLLASESANIGELCPPQIESLENGCAKGSVKKAGKKEAIIHEPAVLIEGVLFRARYLGSTQLTCDGRPTKASRMAQAQEAVARVKAPDGEIQPSTEIDLFISTEKIMVLNTDLQARAKAMAFFRESPRRTSGRRRKIKDILMDHSLRSISYIADIGDVVVLMARRAPNDPHRCGIDPTAAAVDDEVGIRKTPRVVCHVFESDESAFIAQSIGQAFQVAYMEFLRANGIDDPAYLREIDYQDVLNSQEMLGEELEMFARKETQKDVVVSKKVGEPLGVVVVESGWGSMVPTVVIANMAPGGPASRSNQINIGDQIIAINGISLVGLPLIAAQQNVKNAKSSSAVRLTVVSTPPVVEVRIKRPETRYQLGFSVQNGVICSLLRGGIAERGGIRVGHRIIEINHQSVVAVPHDRIVNMLATATGEIHMKTMPTSMFRLLTGQEQPNYI